MHVRMRLMYDTMNFICTWDFQRHGSRTEKIQIYRRVSLWFHYFSGVGESMHIDSYKGMIKWFIDDIKIILDA